MTCCSVFKSSELTFSPLCGCCLSLSLLKFLTLASLTHLFIHTKSTRPLTHVAYTTHLLAKYKHSVIDRSLHPASSSCVLIFSAGPVSPVHSVHDELLHGSSFFLPSPSPLWPRGRNGKTSLVNYLCVHAAPATYHTAGQQCEAAVCLCVCVICVGMYKAASTHRNTLSLILFLV